MQQWSLLYVEIFPRTHQRGCWCLGLDPTLAGWGLLLFPAPEALASLPLRACVRNVSGLLGSLPCPGRPLVPVQQRTGEPCSWELPAQSFEAITVIFILGTKLVRGQSLGRGAVAPPRAQGGREAGEGQGPHRVDLDAGRQEGNPEPPGQLSATSGKARPAGLCSWNKTSGKKGAPVASATGTFHFGMCGHHDVIQALAQTERNVFFGRK